MFRLIASDEDDDDGDDDDDDNSEDSACRDALLKKMIHVSLEDNCNSRQEGGIDDE